MLKWFAGKNMNNSVTIEGNISAGESFLIRGRFQLPADAHVKIRLCGASSYQGWLNGQPLADGPLRYLPQRPEYEEIGRDLNGGEHVLAFSLQYVGGKTRLMLDIPAFLWCEIRQNDEILPVEWCLTRAQSDLAGKRRINPILPWADARDTRREPANWQQVDFDDAEWEKPRSPAVDLPEPVAAKLASPRRVEHQLSLLESGPLAHVLGYSWDDPAAVFYTRDRVCRDLPARGRWFRYDLGRVRLGRPRITLELPAGSTVEFALSEHLSEGRVSPWITLSSGQSCNVDRFIVRGGKQTLCPYQPKGGRFLEIHILQCPADMPTPEVVFEERVYHPDSEAAFCCGDPILDRIWQIGVETYRACSEDALTDNPTRERGQWLGDAAGVGIETAAVAYHDLRLIRRSLVQAAQSARHDGLVAGMSTGDPIFLPTYSLMWAPAIWSYFQYTGDNTLLEELLPAAEANHAALRSFWTENGFKGLAEWNFIDWGYNPNSPLGEGAVDLFYLQSLRATCHWRKQLRIETDATEAETVVVEQFLRKKFARILSEKGWAGVGYHRIVLALWAGIMEAAPEALDQIEAHHLSAFPNNPDAPRNDDPASVKTPLITPWFSHFALPLLIENGRMDFVLQQYRTCWHDYMLAGGRTTWLEVFDTRWSHCHQWSGCPTWQLTRYILGIRPRLDLGEGHFELRLRSGTLTQARGRVPNPAGGWIEIDWSRQEKTLDYRIKADNPICLLLENGENRAVEGGHSTQVKLSV